MDRWSPNGPLLNFTAATSAPTSVQLVTKTNVLSNDVKVDNTSGTVDAVIGWGEDDTTAKLNASAASNVTNCALIQHGTIQVISIPCMSYVSGKTASGTAVIYVQTGIGG